MREIKFRGRGAPYGKEWFVGDLNTWSAGDSCIFDHKKNDLYAVVPETVGQYTGLKDINGREIYEGDIVECNENDEFAEDKRYCVKYFGHEGYPAFELDGWEDGECNGLSHYDAVGIIRVIGNIHDNPELLKGDK